MTPVIIVGGGPIGLTMALALERAGIDCVVLEKRNDLVAHEGADLVLLPMALRALSQFDILEYIRTASVPLRALHQLNHKGRLNGELAWFKKYQENFGQYPLVISRSELLRILFETLPAHAKAKVHANKKVTSVKLHQGSATVTCDDGSNYIGQMVIGADGAYSTIRRDMREAALEATDRQAVSTKQGVNETNPFVATYNVLWFRFPRTLCETLTPGTAFEVHGKNVAAQLFAGRDNVAVGVYKRLLRPTKSEIRYNEADREAAIESCSDLPLVPGGKLVLGQAYKRHVRSGMVTLDVGVLNHWSHGRIVLVGDAAHKFTPNTGSGFNYGVIDVVVLANELHGLVSGRGVDLYAEIRLNPVFDNDELSQAFARYQEARMSVVKAGHKVSSSMMALSVRPTAIHSIGSKFISMGALQEFFSRQDALVLAKSPRFNFIDSEEPFCGQIPWVTEGRSDDPADEKPTSNKLKKKLPHVAL